MSAAAQVATPPGSLLQTVHAYNSLVENQRFLTPAEFRLGMMIVRRGAGYRSDGVSISDRHWSDWTGLDPRSKELAVKGLQKKCFRMEGRGDKAKFYFERSSWEQYAKSHTSDERPKVEKPAPAVKAQPGVKIHRECASGGCALLAREGLKPVPAIPDAKQISQTCTGSAGEEVARGSTRDPGGNIGLSLVPATKIAKQISQTALKTGDAVERVWMATLQALQSFFPMIGVAFLVQLVAIVRALFPDLGDDELARAVEYAGKNAPHQKKAGLFLLTVPEAIAALRRTQAPAKRPDLVGGVRMLLSRVRDALRARGAPFEACVLEVGALLIQLDRDPTTEELKAIEARTEALELAIWKAAADTLDASGRAAVEAAERSIAKLYHGKMPEAELRGLMNMSAQRATFDVLGIPRLDQFYA